MDRPYRLSIHAAHFELLLSNCVSDGVGWSLLNSSLASSVCVWIVVFVPIVVSRLCNAICHGDAIVHYNNIVAYHPTYHYRLLWPLPMLCSLSLVPTVVRVAGQGPPTHALLYANVSNANLVAISYLISVICGCCMRLHLHLGLFRGCPGSTCISLYGWKGVTLSLLLLSHRVRE